VEVKVGNTYRSDSRTPTHQFVERTAADRPTGAGREDEIGFR
jgi:hypothetical protein